MHAEAAHAAAADDDRPWRACRAAVVAVVAAQRHTHKLSVFVDGEAAAAAAGRRVGRQRVGRGARPRRGRPEAALLPPGRCGLLQRCCSCSCPASKHAVDGFKGRHGRNGDGGLIAAPHRASRRGRKAGMLPRQRALCQQGAGRQGAG